MQTETTAKFSVNKRAQVSAINDVQLSANGSVFFYFSIIVFELNPPARIALLKVPDSFYN